MKTHGPGLRPVVAVLAVALVGGLAAVACSDDDDAAAKPTSTRANEAASSPTVTMPRIGEARLGSIHITGAMIRETANDVTAMYMTINNAGGTDRLMSASTPISPMVQIHETVMSDGAMKMQEVTGGSALAAGADTVFKPGGFHLMVMNLKAPLKAGETVQFELTFEKAGKVSLVVPVKTVGETTAIGGGGMAAATPTTGISR